jgi:hypothetical protein
MCAAMPKRKEDPVREKRISMEIVVDAYDAWEQALGWYYYLQDTLRFPFPAKCFRKRAVSPLKAGEEVEVVGMPPEEECEAEVFVTIKWQDRTFAVPLSQLEYSGKNKRIVQAIGDWHYWVDRGYRYG